MIAQDMYDYFDQLSDVTGNPWFNDAEKDEFLYGVIYDYINILIGDGDSPPNLEKNKGATENVRSLIENVVITLPSTGLLTDQAVNALSNIGDMITAIAIRLSTDTPVSFVRQNDIGSFEDNTYKKGTSAYPNYTAEKNRYQLYPKEAYTDLEVILLTKPLAITDLPDHKHYEQVAKAMEKTGYITENQALVMMGQSEGK